MVRTSLTLIVCVFVAAAMFAGGPGSAKLPLLIAATAFLVCVMLWIKIPTRRFLLGLLFLTAPVDISKALVPPLDRFYSPGLYVTIGEAVVVLLGVVWALETVLIRRLRLPVTRLDLAAFGFLALVWLGAMHGKAGLLAYASAASYSLCVIGFYVVSHSLQSKRDIRLLLIMVIVGLCFETVYVAAQMATHSFLSLPGAKVAPVGTQGLLYEAENMSVFRPIGTFDHPNALADYMTLLLPSALALVMMGRRRLPVPVYRAAACTLVATTVLLLLTLSRGGWIACLVGTAFVVAIYRRKRIIGTGHLLALFSTVLLALLVAVTIYPQIVLRMTEPDSRSLESRLVLSDQALTIIKSHPLIGVGYGGYNRAAFEHIPPSFALISQDYKKQLFELVVHNHYLLVASELGAPAMVYWICLMLGFVRLPWPLSRWKDPGMFALGVGIAGAMVSQMVYLSSDNYDADIRVFLLWLAAGVLQAITLVADDERRLLDRGSDAPLQGLPGVVSP